MTSKETPRRTARRALAGVLAVHAGPGLLVVGYAIGYGIRRMRASQASTDADDRTLAG